MYEKNNKLKIISLTALFVAVVGLSVAYAALSTTLKITGSAKVNSAKWDVHFVAGTSTKTGSATFTNPTVTSTSISNYNATFTKPGDSVSYTFSVTNEGSIDAKLNTFTKSNLSCTGSDSSVASNICSKLDYSVKYEDGTTINNNDVLAAGQTKKVKILLTFRADSDIVASVPVTINGLGVTFIYGQK